MLFYRGRQNIVDENGDAVSGAKATFYLSGTDTLAPVYTTSSYSVQHPNPVTASDTGFLPPIYLDPTLTYKVIITDFNGGSVPDGVVDPVVQAQLTEPQVSAVLNPRTTAEASVPVTPSDFSHAELEDSRRYGAVGDAVTEDHQAIQREINVAQKYSGTDFDIGRGRFKLGAGLIISGNRIHLRGRGKYATELVFNPSANGSALQLINGATTINQGSIRDISFWSDDSTYTKTAIEVIDSSGYSFENITIGGSVAIGSSGFWAGGSGSIGIRTRGRDSGTFRDIFCFANRPLVISPNPNIGSPPTQISLDHVNFHNITFGAASNPCVEIESGSVLTQVTFTGHQAWVLGTGGLKWVDATTPGASNGLVLENVRYENATDLTKYFVHIDLASDLQMLNVRGGQAGLCRGFYLRGINNAHIDSFFYSDSSREAMNANATVDEIVFTNCFWQNGSTATLSGVKAINSLPGTVSGPLPKNGFLTITSTSSYQEIIDSTIGGPAATLANDAKVVIGSGTQCGPIVIVSDTEMVSAIYELRGTNHAASEINDAAGFFTNIADNASSYNIYWDATALSGAGGYVIQNKRGSDMLVRVMRLGRA